MTELFLISFYIFIALFRIVEMDILVLIPEYSVIDIHRIRSFYQAQNLDLLQVY